jgi:phosphate uptake regulator
MPFKIFRDEGGEAFDRIEAKLQAMLGHNRYELDLAVSALFGEVVAREVNDDLRSTDQKVNSLEREIRRELVVHSSVRGGVDTPAILVYMSIVKDVERVGDYAKNLLDLALDGSDFSSLEDAADWRRVCSEISSFISDAGEAFKNRNADRCRSLLAHGDSFLSDFDDRVSRLVRGDDTASQPVARALAYRYLKRIVAHLMNLLSAVVMPLDQLDYFILDPEKRSSR